jgi:hypothetical protein
MVADGVIVGGGRVRPTAVVLGALLAVLVGILRPGTASAHIGESFLNVPGVAGSWRGTPYKKWVKAEAQYWKQSDFSIFGNRSNQRAFRRGRMFYSGPDAPHTGASTLALAIDKHDRALPKLMEQCAKKVHFAELGYAEPSQRVRSLAEYGPRPPEMPEYYEYKLKNAVFSDCPVVADAPEQAIVISFDDIEWVNYHDQGDGVAIKPQPAVLEPIKSSGTTKSFVVSWFAVANDVSDDQCPQMNSDPTEDDYYALMSKEEADKRRAEVAGKGISYENGQMGLRGPHQLNVCLLPGIVRDPGQIAPQTKFARGLNLDGNDGKSAPPAGIRAHKNYVTEDGRTGIDNQLFTVMGCMKGYLGHKGFLMQYSNEQRRNGRISMLVQISGIDDERNDDSVDVTLLYSQDPMAKDATGTRILSNYTFRVSDLPEYTPYFTRLHGRIVNGVVVTDPVGRLQINPGMDPELTLYNAALRLQFMPDGSLKGVVGGYQDWRRLAELNSNSNSEHLYGFQCPALYGALKRSADGLRDPVTGEFNGISSAYDIEAVPAFIPPAQYATFVTQAEAHDQTVP